MRTQQGFFTVARTCPQCRGTGKIITNPCKACRGAGRVSKDRKIMVKIPPGIHSMPSKSPARAHTASGVAAMSISAVSVPAPGSSAFAARGRG